MAISRKTWLGLAQEATPGTAITTPVRYVPCKSGFKATQKPSYPDEDRNARSKVFTVVYGPRSAEITIKGAWYNDASVPFLIGALGGYSVAQPNATNAPTVYKHTIYAADVPPTFTLCKYYQTEAYYFSYCAVTKWGFKFSGDDKAVENDVTLVGRFPQTLTTPPTPTFTTLAPFAGILPTLTLGSLGATVDINELSLEYSQKVDVWTPPGGSPDYVALYFGDQELSISFTARFDAPTLWDGYWKTPTDDNLHIDIQGPLITSYSGTNYNQAFHIDVPIMNYETLEHDEGKTNLLIKAKCTARRAADLSTQLFGAYVQNTVVSYANG